MQWIIDKINYILGLNSHMTWIIEIVGCVFLAVAFLLRDHNKVLSFIISLFAAVFLIIPFFERFYNTIVSLGSEAFNLETFIRSMHFIVFIILILSCMITIASGARIMWIISLISVVLYIFLLVTVYLIDKNASTDTESIRLLLNYLMK